MRILKFLAVLLAVLPGVLVLAGCQSPATVAPANPLVGTAWLAWDINGSGPGGKTYATLVFNPGRISGSGGCNRFSGALEVKADAWQASDIAVTRMECAPELMKEEAAFLGALEAARSHRVEGGLLTLIDESGQTRLRLVHLPRPPAQPGFIGPEFVRGLPPG
ncbi:MAG TPA: META domain-containing protein [Burkholderiales bacterium]|jgi:heat shock protein HslJ|nr:META domain-containing protein [Burkholderiales bacterium]